MKLFHTSPTEISKIDASGRFGEFLFFSSDVYHMTASAATVYSIEIDENAIIEAGSLFYHEDAERLVGLVGELAECLSIDEDTAEKLIEEGASVHDLDSIEPEDMADASWDVQRFTARAAKLLGFRGVAVQDEQGTAYMIDMLGHEQELVAE